MHENWKVLACYCCNGIAWGGEYPRTCETCKGGGTLWLSPSGTRLALYPGGPFAGVASEDDRKAAITQEESWKRHLEIAKKTMSPEAYAEWIQELTDGPDSDTM